MDNEIKIPKREKVPTMAPGSKDAPGRNSAALGLWIAEKLSGSHAKIADPMCGVGQMHQLTTARYPEVEIYGCDMEPRRVGLARLNMIRACVGLAESWTPPEPPALVMFSPPYPNCDHDSGRSGKQIEMKVQKHLTSGQSCPGTRNLLPVFLQVATYCRKAPMAVIVRNWIERNSEVDWASEVSQSMVFAGFQVERFWRSILPGPTTQWKLKSGKQTVFVDREWVLVGRRRE